MLAGKDPRVKSSLDISCLLTTIAAVSIRGVYIISNVQLALDCCAAGSEWDPSWICRKNVVRDEHFAFEGELTFPASICIGNQMISSNFGINNRK